MSDLFPVVASDHYAEKTSSLNILHIGPSPSIISKRQLPVSSTMLRFILHDSEFLFVCFLSFKIIHSQQLCRFTGY